MAAKSFSRGDKIEVRSRNDVVVVWHPATVIRSSPIEMHVQYDILTDGGVPRPSRRRVSVAVDDVRPAFEMQQQQRRLFEVGEEVEAFCRERNGWRKGRVVDDSGYKYTVSFDGGKGQSGHFVEVERWMVRAVREWLDGEWVPPFSHILQKSSVSEVKSRSLRFTIRFSGKACNAKFNEGMLVEITSDEDGFRGSWYTAVIVEPLGNDNFLVEYRTLTTDDKTEFLKEEVNVSCIRPFPPTIHRIIPFHYLEQVDAWYNDGWWEGQVLKVINGCKYVVGFNHGERVFTQGEMVFEHCKLRPHQEWIDGKWSAPSKVTRKSFESIETKLKRKLCGKNSEPTFKEGMMVEVKSDVEGYQGSWYCAVIVSSHASESFLVEYQTLKTDDESEFLRESVCVYNMRPFPPNILISGGFQMLEEVDAWYNDGWWVGIVSKVLDGLKYAVYFWTTNEELIFQQFNLRPHQEWIGGKWVAASTKRSKLLLNTKLQNAKVQKSGFEVGSSFINGMKVEVRSDEEGHRGSWYPAVIVKPLGSRKYLIKYQTLETDDGTELLKEEAHTLCIRPCPPIVQSNAVYKPFEEVDAWYNDGWWVGQIGKVLEGKKYTVYFSFTNDILEFEHSDLRPHQDWINGQWVSAKRGHNLTQIIN